MGKMDKTNKCYQAMLVLAAIHSADMELAENVSSEIKLNAEYEQFDVNELVENIPNIQENKAFEFEINAETESLRKRKLYQRKRAKNAEKLRKKNKEFPELYKDPINWEGKEKKVKKEQNVKKRKNVKTKSPQKKKKKFRGAQGGSGTSNKFQVYDVQDAKNKNKGGKVSIPQHIKKRKKRG